MRAAAAPRDAGVYLVSPETAAASCLTGVYHRPHHPARRQTPVAMPEHFLINDNMVDLPAAEDEYEQRGDRCAGPNIKPLPEAAASDGHDGAAAAC